jgi:hypothetical protein
MSDAHPALPHDGTTLASCLCALMKSLGRPEWSMARLQGVMGHAFHFEMAVGGGNVKHDNMDWGPALDFLSLFAKFQSFKATKHDTDINLPALKQEARDAVRASLENGSPALVWQPMSLAQKESDHPAHHANCWGLIVGYNERDETYTVRHPFVDTTYTVRFDLIGHADPAELFRVLVYDGPSQADECAMHRTALRNAVAFAHATRFAADDARNAKRRAAPHGFAAYELWREAFAADEVPTLNSCHHVEVLSARRRAAAGYLREAKLIFPNAAVKLEAAAMHYDHELEPLNVIHDLCNTACQRGAWHANERAGVRAAIGDALQAERKAVCHIQEALEVLDG